MKPTKDQIRRQVRRLRRLIEHEATPDHTLRVAYAMETALRWTIEDTDGWDLVKEAKANGDLARQGK